MKTAYLSLGSNLGDRRRSLSDAVLALNSEPGVRVEKISNVYETNPVGVVDQPDFLNLVVEVATTLEPGELLARCMKIETRLGRVRTERWGPRTIDIDMIWFGGVTMKDPVLTLPHPRMKERAFVLVPLAEIAPDLCVDDMNLSERAEKADHSGLRLLGPLQQ